MKVIAFRSYGSPDVLAVEEFDTPTPAANELRIKVHAAAVSSADTAFRQGTPFIARLFSGLMRPKNPVLGTEFAGVVDAIGADVTRFEVGDEVFAASGTDFGAHAEYLCLPEDGALALKPEGVSWADAAGLCEGTLTALPFLRDVGQVRPGHKVLINGASGSIGTVAVQLAKHLGAEVTAVCSARNADLVRSLGADHVIDYATADFTQRGEVWDVIFDAVSKSSFSRCKHALKAGGVYLATVPSLGILFQSLWTRMVGSKRAKISFTGLRASDAKAADLRLVKELVEAGVVRPVIDGCFSPEQAAEAHRLVETGHKRGNAVLQFVA